MKVDKEDIMGKEVGVDKEDIEEIEAIVVGVKEEVHIYIEMHQINK